MRRHLALVALLLGLLAVAAPSTFAAGPKQKDNDTQVQLLAINDFHGNLEPPAGSGGRISVGPGATVDAGTELIREGEPVCFLGDGLWN